MKITTTATAGIVLTAAILISSIGTATAQSRTYKTAMEECFWGLLFPNEDQRGLSLGLNLVSGALGSYAYTSATLTPDTFCSEKSVATASFIKESYPQLAEDIVRGDGKYLTAVLEIAGCESTIAQTAVSSDLRGDLSTELAQEGYSNLDAKDKTWRMFESLNLSAAENCTV